MSFQDDVTRLETQRREQDPVLVARRSLAPIKAEAEQLGKDWTLLLAQLMPEITIASNKQAQARKVGVHNPSLDDTLRQIGNLVSNGGGGFQDVVARIEGLTPFLVSQVNYMATLPGLLNSYKAVFGSLRGLVAQLPSHLAVLERFVADAAARPAPTLGPQNGPDMMQVAQAQRPRPLDDLDDSPAL